MDGDEARKFAAEADAKMTDETRAAVDRLAALDAGTPLPNDVATKWEDIKAEGLAAAGAEIKRTMQPREIEPVTPVEKIEKLSDLAVTFGADVDRGQPLHEKITSFIPPSADSVIALTKDGIERIKIDESPTQSLKGSPFGESRLYQPLIPRRGELFSTGKVIALKDGPLDGFSYVATTTDENGLLYFFREVRGEIEQCVYRIVLKERERPLLAAEASDEEKAAHRALPREWDWVGDYVGKRKCPVPMVNGIRKAPTSAAPG